MSFVIPPESPKKAAADAFASELAKALAARDVSRKELSRVLGVGRTTIWHYLAARTLPKLEAASAIAAALDWPRLRELVLTARLRACRRPGCRQTFVNDVGSEARKYCSIACREIVEAQKLASRHARRSGQTDSHQARRAQIQRLRSGLRIADDRASLLQDAIAAMCAGCEPEGICRTRDCPLRPYSPLPLERHAQERPTRTTAAIRREIANRPERQAKRSATANARWAREGERERQAEQSRAFHAGLTPEQRAERIAKAKASYPAKRRSETSRRTHAARRHEQAS